MAQELKNSFQGNKYFITKFSHARKMLFCHSHLTNFTLLYSAQTILGNIKLGVL